MKRLPCIALVIAAVACPSASAATFTPTRLDDPVPGKCKPDNCSLREAVAAAVARDGRDTVALGRGRYEMELAPGSNPADDGDWWVYNDTTLRGQGPGKTVLDANGLDRVMQMGNFQDDNKVEGLRMTGGHTTSNGAPGAVIAVGYRVTLKRVVIAGNTSAAGIGGAARLEPAISLKVIDSRFAGNEAVQGGGLWLASGSAGVVTGVVRGSTIRGNEASLGGGIYSSMEKLTISKSTISGNAGAEGGGLDIVSMTARQPETTISASTISGNSAGKGGGVLIDGNQPFGGLEKPIVTVTNSTVAGNQVSDSGGGIMADNAATVDLNNTTVAYNRADTDGVSGGVGGGVFQHSGAAFELGDAVIAQNTLGPASTPQQCEGAFGTAADGLARENQSSGSCSFGGVYTLVADAMIGPLADNGGPTETVKLRTGSPAIGFSESCPKRDQRGKPRPEEDCDSGAFERKGP